MTSTDDDTLRHFANPFLPEDLRRIGEAVRGLAYHMASTLPSNAERRAGLRKLLEARDCFVRAQATGADPTVVVAKTTFDRLEAAAQWLHCLEAAGVDNWPGCEEAARHRRELEEAKTRAE